MNKALIIGLAACAVIAVGMGVKQLATQPEATSASALSVSSDSSGVANGADLANGKIVYDYWCGACHDPGPGHPGTQSLEIKYNGDIPAALEDRTDLSPELTAHFVRNGYALMPFFRKTEISDDDLRDLSAYLARKE